MDTDGRTDGRTDDEKQGTKRDGRSRTITFKAEIDLPFWMPIASCLHEKALSSDTAKWPTQNEDVRVRERRSESSLSPSARACAPVPTSFRRVFTAAAAGAAGGREPKALNAFFSMQLPSLAERTNERLAMLPGCQPACLPAAAPTSQTACEREGERRLGLPLGTLTIPLQHLRAIEREREMYRKRPMRASQRNAHEEGFRNSERIADRAT